ncbi:hypothetical protein [Rummeliibacillus stabekisii]|uniref:Uncharacterized protein n=1 Tax=Rummeliibacillus stabekisii TaxID=241244 RepID=A0A143HG09_9BACL|nr:hypothetical protein [Rummeliibacillus stabekisii]AMX00431.1 hypothetical protein ATY39_14020 [Rummeliibacillus stabekisii]
MTQTLTTKKYSAAEILSIMTSYNWMINYIANMREEFNAIYAPVAKYDGMPHAKGGKSDPIWNEITRIERCISDYGETGDKVFFMQEFLTSSAFEKMEEKNKMILQHTLNGMKQTKIAKLLMCSQPAIQYRQCKIAEYICEEC